MKLKLFLVDSFTDEAFKGNPAGVCILNEQISEELMQKIAMEVNAAETAFVQKQGDGKYSIRYFSPEVEIAFCGHATVASAKVLFEKHNSSEAEFTTYQGLKLSASKYEDRIKVIFPLYGTVPYSSESLLDALHLNEFEDLRYCDEKLGVILRVKDKKTLLSIKPDFEKLKAASGEYRGVCVTAKSDDEGYDFYSRYFAPAVGINEDPVTGSAHSMLARYWSDILGKKEMNAFQLSKRGGNLKLKILDDESLEVTCNAKIVIEGELSYQ